MKVEMKTTLAGPSGTAHPGDVIDVSAEIGKEMLSAGSAVEHKGDKAVKFSYEAATGGSHENASRNRPQPGHDRKPGGN